jgi:hypothetical protein
MTAGTPPLLSARLITIAETSSWSVEPLGRIESIMTGPLARLLLARTFH